MAAALCGLSIACQIAIDCIQVLERFFAIAEIVIDLPDVVQRAGFAGARAQRAPHGQRLIEQLQRLVFLAKVGVHAAHGVKRGCLAEQAGDFCSMGRASFRYISAFCNWPVVR